MIKIDGDKKLVIHEDGRGRGFGRVENAWQRRVGPREKKTDETRD